MQILLASLLFPPYPLTSSTPLSLLQPQPRILSWLTTVSQLLKPLTVDDADMQHWMTFWREKSCVEPCTSRRYPLDNLGISHLFQEHERKHDAPANRHPPSFRTVGIRSTSKTKSDPRSQNILGPSANPLTVLHKFHTLRGKFYALRGSSSPFRKAPAQYV